MADYWKSNERKYCEFCRCWLADNKVSISLHEDGRRHKDNVAKKISAINKQSARDHKEKRKMDSELAKMEKLAMSAYLKDIESNRDLTSQMINEKLQEVRGAQQIINANKYSSTASGTSTSLPISAKKTTWQEAKSDEGHSYYWNTETNEVSWEAPQEGYVSLSDLQVKAQPAQSANKKPPKPPKNNKKFGKKNKQKKQLILKAKPLTPKDMIPAKDKNFSLSRSGNLYGDWKPVVNIKEIDLQLPEQKPVETTPVIAIPTEKQFKVKQISSLEEESSESSFKKRKINNSAKRNVRQRLDDDD